MAQVGAVGCPSRLEVFPLEKGFALLAPGAGREGCPNVLFGLAAANGFPFMADGPLGALRGGEGKECCPNAGVEFGTKGFTVLPVVENPFEPVFAKAAKPLGAALVDAGVWPKGVDVAAANELGICPSADGCPKAPPPPSAEGCPKAEPAVENAFVAAPNAEG